MVTEFASKLGDISTVVSFAALVANGLIPKLLLPDGLLLKTLSCEKSRSFLFMRKPGRLRMGAAPVFGYRSDRSETGRFLPLICAFIRRC